MDWVIYWNFNFNRVVDMNDIQTAQLVGTFFILLFFILHFLVTQRLNKLEDMMNKIERKI